MKKNRNKDTFTPWIKMLERIYNCKVGYVRFPHIMTKEAEHTEHEHIQIVRRNFLAPLIFSKNDVLFPMSKHRKLYGYLKVSQKDFPTSEFLEEIRQFIDSFLLKISKSNINSSFITDVQENRRKSPLNPSTSSHNSTIPLDDIKTEIFADIKPEVMVHSHGLFPLLLEGEELSPIKELAYEIHHNSQRRIFITMDSGVESRITSAKDIKDFGAITLFIPNLPDLKKRTQIYLYLEQLLKSEKNPLPSPRIIAAIKDRPENLIKSRKIFKPLFEILASARIKISRKSKITAITEIAKSIDEISHLSAPHTPPQTVFPNMLRLVHSSKSTTLH